VAAADELGAEGDRRKSVPRVAESGEQDAPAPSAQSISASSRTIRLRSSAAAAIGEAISVPTPASR
jgi:hypothetical protein